MDQVFRSLCQAETRRLLLLMAITAALVLGLQYFELPYGKVLSSLFPAENTAILPVGESSLKSEMVSNMTFSNGLNSSYAVNGTGSGTETSKMKKENALWNESKEIDKGPKNDLSSGGSNNSFGLVFNESSLDNLAKINISSRVESDKNPVNAPAPEMDMAHEQNISFKDAADTLNKNENHELMRSKFSVPPNDSSKTKAPAVKNEKKQKKSKRPPSVVISISEMNNLLLQSHASPRSVAPLWSLRVDQEVLFAKSQIKNAPVIKSNIGLYAPLYRNVSMFIRSYELMENMLKVYIYQEGEKPIFHQPQAVLDGIYASEGWFMKLLEANKKLMTADPGKAHLFYFPFSSRLLELTLYKRHSHKRSNLIQYMKTYVDMIAAKYPFWNRTGGADHFLAACHDWAPAETRGRMLNCIRALCNADIEVGFTIGKDVSLPETYVTSAENPLKNLGGNPPSQRPILAFFAGGMHGYVRPILLNYWENKDPELKIFGSMPHDKNNRNYIQHMKSSKYCICAKGFEVNSPRVVEAIFYECVPVIISDNFVPPFFEVLNWESFAVFVLEKDIPNLKYILLSISEEKYMEMRKRVKKLQQHFLWHAEPVKYDLFHMILHSVWYNRVFQMRPA